MSYIKLILLLLQWADSLFRWMHENRLIKEGEDRAVARALAEMAKRSTTIKEIDERFARMSPADVVKEIDKSGDFRD